MDKRSTFYKVFIPEFCSQRMQIPPKFVDKYMRGQRINNATFLRDSRGKSWPVKISVDGRDLFFEKGWARFVVDNQIEMGDLLFFKLSDDHLFKFLHFGKSGCEKEKRTIMAEEKDVEEEEEEEIEDNNEEEEEEVAGTIGNCVKEEDHYDEGGEVGRNAADDDEEEHEEADEAEVELEDYEKNDEENEEREKESNRGAKKKRPYGPRLTIDDMAKIKDEILGSGVQIPENPYFVLKFNPKKRRELFIPLDLVRYYDLKLASEIKIVNEKWKGGVSKVKKWKSGCITFKGWAAFCKFNHLKTDDKCLLEFVPDRENKRQLCLRVRIFRA